MFKNTNTFLTIFLLCRQNSVWRGVVIVLSQSELFVNRVVLIVQKEPLGNCTMEAKWVIAIVRADRNDDIHSWGPLEQKKVEEVD